MVFVATENRHFGTITGHSFLHSVVAATMFSPLSFCLLAYTFSFFMPLRLIEHMKHMIPSLPICLPTYLHEVEQHLRNYVRSVLFYP